MPGHAQSPDKEQITKLSNNLSDFVTFLDPVEQPWKLQIDLAVFGGCGQAWLGMLKVL